MPARLKIRIMGGRNLPVMDKSSDTSDAFVEVKIGSFSGKTEVCRHSLNPVWNSEWFKFELPDEELQDECLQIRVMDYDRYSADDQIGKIYLNPRILCEESNIMFGFYPIYDTMHGCRGEIFCVIKIETFSDSNKFRQTCVRRGSPSFFHSPIVPHGYYCTQILGFVEEVVVNEDPEYQFIEKFRTSRASNEARQLLFHKLSAEVQRKLGSKALELGGNAVLGYQLCFDMENSSIAVRGIGTTVFIKKIVKHIDVTTNQMNRQQTASAVLSTETTNQTHQNTPVRSGSIEENDPMLAHLINGQQNNLNAFSTDVKKSSPINMTSISSYKESTSDFDLNSPNIKQQTVGSVGSNIFGSVDLDLDDLNTTYTPKYMFVTGLPDGVHLLEYPFVTLKQLPVGLIKHIGGVVSSRSVKHLGTLNSQEDSESESRDAWWMELRKEIRNHTRMLECNSVLGYTEITTIHDDVCILSASGTAAVLHTRGNSDLIAPNEPKINSPSSLTNSQKFFDSDKNDLSSNLIGQQTAASKTATNCGLCHVPYSEKKAIFGSSLAKCAICKKGRVPDVIFTTIELPVNLPSVGTGCLIQARVFRNKKDTRAKEISDSLPFLEYELHKQLLSKLKMKNMNALFNLSVSLSVGENIIVAVASGTAVFLTPLQEPLPIRVKSGTAGKGVRLTRMNDIQKMILDLVERNKVRYGLTNIRNLTNNPPAQINTTINNLQINNIQTRSHSLTGREEHHLKLADSSDDELISPRSLASIKQSSEQCVVLEVDDGDDADIVALMIDSEVPKSFEICNSDKLPAAGADEPFLSIYQTFYKVFRAKITSSKQFSSQLDWIIQSLFVKMRRLTPCALVGLKFKVDAAIESDSSVQITILGTVVGIRTLNESLVCKDGLYLPTHCYQDKRSCISNDGELAFEDAESAAQKIEIPSIISSVAELSNRGNPLCVELTTLSYLPKCKIVKYISNIIFPFVREECCLRERGGLNVFLTSFLSEVNNIVRTHIVSLDGNALLSMSITQLVLMHNPHKNQAQCLIIISGDVVKAIYSRLPTNQVDVNRV